MRKKLALLVLSFSAIAAAGVFSPLKAACLLFECLNGDVVYCCSSPAAPEP